MVVEEYSEQKQQAWEEKLTIAYLTAYWQRVSTKKLPSLKKVLEDSRPKKQQKQSDEQMFEVVKQLQASLAREEG